MSRVVLTADGDKLLREECQIFDTQNILTMFACFNELSILTNGISGN